MNSVFKISVYKTGDTFFLKQALKTPSDLCVPFTCRAVMFTLTAFRVSVKVLNHSGKVDFMFL